MNTEQVQAILDSIDVGRLVKIVRWSVYRVSDDVSGWLVSCVFERPDRDTKIVEHGAGRNWYIDAGATVEQVQRTAFSAVKMLVEHELLEFFTVAGVRLFDPHETRTAHGEALPPPKSKTDDRDAKIAELRGLLEEANVDIYARDRQRGEMQGKIYALEAKIEDMCSHKTPKTETEVIEAFKADTPLNRARRILSAHAANDATWTGCPIEHRRIEFETVVKIVDLITKSR